MSQEESKGFSTFRWGHAGIRRGRATICAAQSYVALNPVGATKEQADRHAGVELASDADFCHSGELLESAGLVEVPNVLKDLSPEEEADWRESTDNVQPMRDATNALLQEARKLSSEIESLNDIDAYLVENPEGDAHLVQALKSLQVSRVVA